MKQQSNVELYENDNQIEQILKKLPKSNDLKGLNILEFIKQKTKGGNFGIFYVLKETIYVVYKFDEAIHKNEAGLLMSKSHIKYAQEHYKVWSLFRLTGMNLSNKFMNDVYNSGMLWQGISHLR